MATGSGQFHLLLRNAGWLQAKVRPRRCRGNPASWRSENEALPNQIWLGDGLDGFRLFTDGNRECGKPHWTTIETVNEDLQDSPIYPIQSNVIHLIQIQCGAGGRDTHRAITMDLGPVSHSPEQAIHDSWCASATAGYLNGTSGIKRDSEEYGRPLDNDREISRIIEIDVGGEAKPIPKWTWK
jgi:hypothetical protein